tara:strand:- start:208 stop:1248 length:1041 start_codon:yes stop_codon:yes gene_type:complete
MDGTSLRASLAHSKQAALSRTLSSISRAQLSLSTLTLEADATTRHAEQRRQTALAIARVDGNDLRWRTTSGCKPNLFNLEWRLPAKRRHKKREHDDLPLAVLLSQCAALCAQHGASALAIAKLQLEIGERFHDQNEWKRALQWWRKRAIGSLAALWAPHAGRRSRITPGDEPKGAISLQEEERFAILKMLRKAHSHVMRLCVGHLVMQGIAALHIGHWLALSDAVDSMNRTVAARAGEREPDAQRPRDLRAVLKMLSPNPYLLTRPKVALPLAADDRNLLPCLARRLLDALAELAELWPRDELVIERLVRLYVRGQRLADAHELLMRVTSRDLVMRVGHHDEDYHK